MFRLSKYMIAFASIFVWVVLSIGTEVPVSAEWEFLLPEQKSDLTNFCVWSGPAGDVFIGADYGIVIHRSESDIEYIHTGLMETIQSVWAQNADELYIASNSHIFHWDGNSFTDITAGTGAGSDDLILCLWGFESGPVYAGVGSNLMRWNGSEWSLVYTMPEEEFYRHNVLDIWGDSEDNLYLMSSSTLVQYDGSDWIEWTDLPWNIGPDTESYQFIWGLDDGTLFLCSAGCVPRSNLCISTIHIWDGTEWTFSEYPIDGPGECWFTDMAGVGNSAFAVALDGYILQWSETAWQNTETHTTFNIYGVWQTGQNNAVAVGSHGEILDWNGTDWDGGTLQSDIGYRGIWADTSGQLTAVSGTSVFQWDKSIWEEHEISISVDLYDVWGAESGMKYIAGASGTIIRGDGDTWEMMDSGTTENLNGIWGLSETNIFAVGDNGTILYWNGTSWEAHTSSVTENLKSVYGFDDSNIFVAGDNGKILNWDGTQWNTMITGSNVNFKGVWGSNPTDVYAVGENFIYHYDGLNWIKNKFIEDLRLQSIWGSGMSDIYAVGYYTSMTVGIWANAAVHWDGSEWTDIHLQGVDVRCMDVAGKTPGEIFTALDRGIVLHWWERILETNLEMPGEMFHESDTFYVKSTICNQHIFDLPFMPVVYLLDVYGELFFWPGWKPFDGDDPSTFDYELRTLEIGDTEISVFDPFEWPDTGSQFADGIMIYGAVLNRSMTDIYGQFSTISFGFE